MPFPDLTAERRRRGWILGVVMGAVFLVLLGRLFALQIVNGEHYAELAQRNLLRPDPIPALRGRIFDRSGRLLAGNHISLDLALEVGHPAYRGAADIRAAVEEVAAALDVPPEPLVERAVRHRALFAPVILAENLQPEQLGPLFERLFPIPGLRIERTPRRWYPYGSVAAHVLGYVGEVSESELARAVADSGYCVESCAGRSGVERQYEGLLRGFPGYTCVTVDAVGRKTDLFPGVPPRAPRSGMDLTLALDLRLQCLADSLLLAARPEHGGAPFGGTVIALDPRNGEVLACSSVPSYDPNRFAIGLKGPEWAALQDETYPLLNRATQALYPPGSLFKVVTTLAGLDAGWLGPGTRMAASCGGGYRFGNRTFRCWRSGGHGGLDLRGAFAQSCDVYFYQLGRRLGIERLTDFAHALGLDAATGIDLPQEKTGLVPTREWYQRKLGTPPPEGNVLNLAIGQGELLVTPVAMAACVGALVTDGWVRQPRVALRANAADGTVAWEAGERGGLRQLPVTEGERDLLRDLLEEVVAHGTGSRAQVKGVRVGGKTGTAQNPHGSDHGLFLGVAPMEAPEIVIVAVIERAGHGGVVAAPIAQRLIEAWLVTLPAEELAAQQVEEEARAQAEAQAQAQWGAEGVQEGALPPGSPTKPSGAAQRSAADRDTIPTRGGGGEEEPPAGIHPSVEPGRDAPTPPAGSEPTVPPGAGSGGRREQGA